MPEIATMSIKEIMVFLFRHYSPKTVLKTAGRYLVVNTYDKDATDETDENDYKCVEKKDRETNETHESDEEIQHEAEEIHHDEEVLVNDIHLDSEDDETPANEEVESTEIKINCNIGKKEVSKIVDVSRKFKTKKIKSKNVNGLCNGYLASGKPCTKDKFVQFNLCKRCFGKLKEKGAVKLDDDLNLYYRDVKFTTNDPNGLFRKGQTIRQYSQHGHLFEFNGLKIFKYAIH